MDNDLQVGTNAQIAPVRSPVSAPMHDSPQIDLDTGAQITTGEMPSKLDEAAVKESKSPTLFKKREPKNFWSVSTKRVFNELSPRQQKEWLDSFKIVEKSYAKMIERLKESYAQLDDVAGVLAPCVDEIVNQLGQTPAQYVAGLIEADREATTNPIDYILKVMAAKGITFGDLGAGVPGLMQRTEDQARIAPVMDRINELEKKISSAPVSDEESLEARADMLSAEIKSFYGQTDSSGRSLYPNWEKYVEQILPMYLSGMSLNDAYNAAIEDAKAQIPQNHMRGQDLPDVPDDVSSRRVSERHARDRERQMLTNVVEQLKQKYQ